MNKKWEKYWNRDNSSLDTIMSITTEVFYLNYKRTIGINNSATYIDFGCGSGVLIDYLKVDCRKIIGLDSSIYYVQKCKNNFKRHNNVSIQLIYDFHDFEKILQSHEVNNIIVHSVIQYFESTLQIHEFLDIIRNISKERKQVVNVLFADIIPKNHLVVYDLIGFLNYAIKHRIILNLIKYLFENIKRKIILNRGNILKVEFAFFEDYANQYNIKITKFDKLSINKGRYAVELIFTP